MFEVNYVYTCIKATVRTTLNHAPATEVQQEGFNFLNTMKP